MSLKEIAAIAFLAALIIHWSWCVFVAYPLVLDKLIKRGVSWIYLPIKWKGFSKKAVSFITPVLLLLVIFLGTAALWLYIHTKLPIYYFYPSAAALAIILLFLHSLWLKKRFRQQEDAYFFLRGKIRRKMESQGKNSSETEMNNLASFQHQNILREADTKGSLVKALREQSSLAKKSKKNQKIGLG